MEATASQITTTRKGNGVNIDGMTWEVDGLLVASVTRSRKHVNCWYLRLYYGPDEYDIETCRFLNDAQNVAYAHACKFR
jgi:hypothetical protein